MSTKTLPIACVFAIFRENEHFAATEVLVNFLGEACQAYGIHADCKSLLCVTKCICSRKLLLLL